MNNERLIEELYLDLERLMEVLDYDENSEAVTANGRTAKQIKQLILSLSN